MSDYRVAEGTGVALESLVVLVPQPRSEGVTALRRTYAADGSVYEEGKYIELQWNVLGNATLYQSILAQFGLDDQTTTWVTIYVPDWNFSYARYNGTAALSAPGVSKLMSYDFPKWR